MGQIMLTRSKGSWAQFIFVCRSHSARELYYAADLYSAVDMRFAIDCFPLHFFLWTSFALWSSWWAFRPCFFIGLSSSWAFGYGFAKMGINTIKKKTPQIDQWHNPQLLPTKNNHPTTTSKLRTTTHYHSQKSKLAKNHHTNHHQHSHTTTNPRNPAKLPSQNLKKPTKSSHNHEICGALEFNEGGAGGASIDDEAWVGNRAWIGDEMED